jgi:hypothetical protein
MHFPRHLPHAHTLLTVIDLPKEICACVWSVFGCSQMTTLQSLPLHNHCLPTPLPSLGSRLRNSKGPVSSDRCACRRHRCDEHASVGGFFRWCGRLRLRQAYISPTRPHPPKSTSPISTTLDVHTPPIPHPASHHSPRRYHQGVRHMNSGH